MKVNLLNIGGFLLIPFCSLITHTLIPVPPTIVLWILSFLVCGLYVAHNDYKISTINSLSIVPLLFSGYLFFSQLLIGVDFRALVSPFFAPLYFVITIFYLRGLNIETSKKLITNFISVSIFIFSVEAIWRMLHPSIPDLEVLGSDSYKWFYVFKGQGLMYVETNSLAIHILIVLFFSFWWGEYLGKKFLISKILLLILLSLTFSRASILSFFIGVMYFTYLRKMNNIYFYLLAGFFFVFLLVIFPIYVLPFLESDPSSNTKVQLISEIFSYYSNANIGSIIFGIGNYNSKEVFSIYAHNYFLVYAIEMGLIGLLLLLAQFAFFIIISRKEILVLLIPFIVQVMSSSTIFIPHFYMVSAIIVYFSRRDLKLVRI